jgi:hypothetical protein
MGQIDRNDTLSSRLRGIPSKKKSCTPPVYNKKNDLSRLISAQNRFQISSDSSRFLIPSSLLHNSKTVDDQKDEMELTKITKTENINKNHEMSEKQEHSTSNSMRSGVYFNNCEIFNEMHPSQVHYQVRHVTKVATLPMGKPLARPHFLGVKKPRCAAPPVTDSNSAEEFESKKVDGSRKRERGQTSSSNTEGGEEENVEDDDPSKRCRMDGIVCPSNKKRLSGEETLFLEAALALSVSKFSGTTTTTTTTTTTKENRTISAPQNNRRSVPLTPTLSGQQTMMPPPPFSFFQATSSKRVLLSLGQQQ